MSHQNFCSHYTYNFRCRICLPKNTHNISSNIQTSYMHIPKETNYILTLKVTFACFEVGASIWLWTPIFSCSTKALCPWKFDCWDYPTVRTFDILGLNAFGFLSRIEEMVSFLTDSFSILLQQLLQLQFLQYSPLAKHSQYNFKQREFLQLQFFLPWFIFVNGIPYVVYVGGK